LAQDRVIPSSRVTSFVNIREAPDGDSNEKGRLAVGESLPFVSSVPQWYEVRLADGTSGFVSRAWTTVTGALAARQQDELRIHYLNIGAGSCAVVECPGPDAPPMIVDCGSSGGTASDLTRDQTTTYIQTILAQNSTSFNVVVSHGDTDHYAYIPSALAGLTPQHIWQGGDDGDYSQNGFQNWVQTQEANGAHRHVSFTPHWHNNKEAIGSHLSCGIADSFVLTVNTGSSKNAQSLMLMLRYQDFTAIFTGDAEGSTEAQAISNYPNDLKATVLTSSHHGASTLGSNSQTWADAVVPKVLISSSGTGFFHPRCTAVNRYATTANTLTHDVQCGTTNAYQPSRTNRAHYVTEINGAVVVTTSGKSPLSLHCTRSADCGVQIPHD
jgi:competence protein ComEC